MEHQELFKKHSDVIWDIANLLRGPYRPPQYRRVMIPLTVLRRLDCVLEASKAEVLKAYNAHKLAGTAPESIEKIIQHRFKLNFFNTSNFTLKTLLDDPKQLVPNLVNYLDGFSPSARKILDKFNFKQEIKKLDLNDRLFKVIQAITALDLYPEHVPNLAMGYIFEDLVRRFNEQANEEAGDHFTPREVIKLMVNLLINNQEVLYTPGKAVHIYDPTCGTGGMLSEAEKFILDENPSAHVELFGQEYNDESFAICGADLMIKGENTNQITFGDTLGTGRDPEDGAVDGDGHPDKTFHYMLANPPFGVEWKPEQDYVTHEHNKLGFNGRFGAGLPRINDGALLFLQHMISKRVRSEDEGGEPGAGSRIAVVFNGSPLFTGDAGSGESNIRRWIIENDWLEAVVGLPDQLFYNTGISTYIWIVTNRKSAQRKGKVQLINASDFAWKMKKSLGDKRKKLGEGQADNGSFEPKHIEALTLIHAGFQHNQRLRIGEIQTNIEPDRKKKRDQDKSVLVSKVFDNRDFGYLKITVERPLRLNFAVTDARIQQLKDGSFYTNLALSKKRKDQAGIAAEIAEGQAQQAEILAILDGLKPQFAAGELIRNRDDFEALLKRAFTGSDIGWSAPLKKALLAKGALGEQDPEADICRDAKDKAEPDADLRDTENVTLPADTQLPLPLDYESNANKGKVDKSVLLELVRRHCEDYLASEVLPYRPDAWIDFDKTKVGYEIAFNRHFYQYEAPRPLAEIEAEIKALEGEIMAMLSEVV